MATLPCTVVWHEATIPVTYLHKCIQYNVYVCTYMLFPALHCCGCSLLCVQSALVAHVRTYVCINIHTDFISHECRLFLTTSDLHLVASLMRLYSCMMDEIKDSGPDGKPTMQATQVRTYMHMYTHTPDTVHSINHAHLQVIITCVTATDAF